MSFRGTTLKLPFTTLDWPSIHPQYIVNSPRYNGSTFAYPRFIIDWSSIHPLHWVKFTLDSAKIHPRFTLNSTSICPRYPIYPRACSGTFLKLLCLVHLSAKILIRTGWSRTFQIKDQHLEYILLDTFSNMELTRKFMISNHFVTSFGKVS